MSHTIGILLTRLQGLDALMNALKIWNGGVILISHDERFITSVANEAHIVLLCYTVER